VFFLCNGLGFLVELVIDALGEFLAMGFVFFFCVFGVCPSSGFLFFIPVGGYCSRVSFYLIEMSILISGRVQYVWGI
jgi:hypothetical protein